MVRTLDGGGCITSDWMYFNGGGGVLAVLKVGAFIYLAASMFVTTPIFMISSRWRRRRKILLHLDDIMNFGVNNMCQGLRASTANIGDTVMLKCQTLLTP